MKQSLTARQREILSSAMHAYEALAKTTSKNLESLNLDDVAVQSSIGNIGVIRDRLGTTSTVSEDVEFQHELVLTVKDCLHLLRAKTETVKSSQLKLTIVPSDTEATDTEATQTEIDALLEQFSDQLSFA